MYCRRIVLIVTCVLLCATGCRSRAPDTAKADTHPGQGASQHDAPASPSKATDEDGQVRADTDKVDFSARSVKTPPGVRTLGALQKGKMLTAQWTGCTLVAPLVDTDGLARSPIRRMLVLGDNLYLVTESGENNTKVRAFTLQTGDDTCTITPRDDFAEGGQLALGSGVADVGIMGDLLVAVGVSVRLFDLEDGTSVDGCDDLRGLTRIVGRTQGSGGVVRKSGHRVYRAQIDRTHCELTAQDEIAGEETLGMSLAPVGEDGLFATMQLDRISNSLAFLKDGKLVWRYFPGDETFENRVSIISSAVAFEGNALVLRSLAKTIQLIDTKGRLRADIELRKDADVGALTFPDALAAVDDTHVLVAFRTLRNSNELSGISVKLLTLTPHP